MVCRLASSAEGGAVYQRWAKVVSGNTCVVGAFGVKAVLDGRREGIK
jgi:hypothetical protein